MTLIKQFSIIFSLCFINSATLAASIVDMSGEGLSGLATNPASVENWPSTLNKLVKNYSGIIIETDSSDEMVKLNEIDVPTAYIANIDEIQVFALTRQAVPDAMYADLLGTFTDLVGENFDEYNFGLTLMAVKIGNNSYSVSGILLKNTNKIKQSSKAAFAITNDFTLFLPEGTSVISSSKNSDDRSTTETYSLNIATSGENTREFVTSQLSNAGIDYEESSVLGFTTLTISNDDLLATLLFEAESEDSDGNIGKLSITRVN